MTTGPTNLYDFATATLAAVVAAFAADAVTLPARHYLYPGTPIAECDALVVAYTQLFMGIGGQGQPVQPTSRGQSRVAQLDIFIYRCGVPGPKGTGLANAQGPAVTDLNAYAQTLMTDAYVLHRGVWRARYGGTFQDWLTGLMIGPASPLPAQGGIGGTTMTIQAALD